MESRSVRTLAVAVCLLIPTLGWSDDWKFRLTPFIWLAGLQGDVGAFPPLPSAPVDVSPSDALKDTETAFFLIAEARKNRHGLYLDTVYSDVRSDLDLIPEFDLTANSITKSTMISAAYEYAWLQKGDAVIDVLVGARYWNIDSTFSFSGGLGALDGRTLKGEDSWVDPMAGVKARVPFGQSKFYFAGGLVIGGFGVGSDMFYELNTNVGYQWNKSIGTTVGYRTFGVDYEEPALQYDVEQSGWQLGLTWSF